MEEESKVQQAAFFRKYELPLEQLCPFNLLNRTIQPSALQTTDAVGFLYLVTHVRTNCVTIRHQLWPQSVKHSKHYFELI